MLGIRGNHRQSSVAAAILTLALSGVTVLSGCGGSNHSPGPTPPNSTALSGIVTWPDGSPAANVPIQIQPEGNGVGNDAATIMTDDSGNFTSDICASDDCTGLQAELSVSADSDFPDGCNISMTETSSGDGTNNWQIGDQDCQNGDQQILDSDAQRTWEQAKALLQ